MPKQKKVHGKWYDNLGTKGEDNIYKIAKATAKQKKDITHIAAVTAKDGRVIVEEKERKDRWKEYFSELLNVENQREPLPSSSFGCSIKGRHSGYIRTDLAVFYAGCPS